MNQPITEKIKRNIVSPVFPIPAPLHDPDGGAPTAGYIAGMQRIGTAGWTIPAASRPRFTADGAQLERYATRLNCVEINSSFYRPHRAATYARWAASVPAAFAFALKIPKTITHVRHCADCDDDLARFIDDSSALGSKRRVLLVQLPPSFAFDDRPIGHFFEMLRSRYAGFAVCEPRHPSWFTPQADARLRTHHIARVAADPEVCAGAALPGGWPGIVYYRQHGSPRTYYSRYEPPEIAALAVRLDRSSAPERWCIFDNTAAGAAAENALELALLAAACNSPRVAAGYADL